MFQECWLPGPAVRRRPRRNRHHRQWWAVPPFINASGADAGDLGARLADAVAADLEQLGTFSVVGHETFGQETPGTEPERAADNDAVARRVARASGAGWLVAGRFARAGTQLRITVRIVSVNPRTATLTISVDGTVADLTALQDRLVGEVGDGLRRISALAAPTRGAGGGALGAAASRVAPQGAVEGATPDAVSTRGGRASPPPPAAQPAQPPSALGASASRVAPGVAPVGVTGRLAIGDADARLGEAVEAGALTGRPTVRPERAQIPPTIDGRLDDAIWRDAVRITEFVQRRPLDGAPATEASEVYIAYDSTDLYLAFYAHYSDPSIRRANRADRDQALGDDNFSVYFDTFLDQQRAYVFSVNGYGVQGDSIVSSRGGGGFGGGRGGGGFSGVPRGDRSWDALFASAGRLVRDGFTAEIAIPFKSLRYPQRAGNTMHRWGFQIVRSIQGKDETAVWSPVSRDVAGFLPQMGVLEGVTGLSTSRNLEILPTFTAVRFGSRDPTTGDILGDPSAQGGVNVKYGVTSNLIADATFNPDFSQIESDQPQIEVNQRFALFFPELRPFFLEGAEIFAIPGPITVVHTRTIVDPLYGAKLTGKVGRTTVGVMYANDDAPGDVEDPTEPAFGQAAQTLVGRVRYDLYAESHIGGIVTHRGFLDSDSQLGGLDGNFRLGDTHSLGFRAMGTQHRDLEGVETSGHLFDVAFRRSGRNLSYTVASYAVSPDFKTDVGFVRRTNLRRTLGNISYRWWPESWIINWGPRVSYGRNWDFDGVLIDENAQLGVSFSFAKNINLNANVSREMERFAGINFRKTRYSVGGPVNTSRRIGFGLFFSSGDEIFFDPVDPFLGRETGLRTFIGLRPLSRLRSQINITTSRFTDPRNGDRKVFSVEIFRVLTTYQFTDRLLFRNISEYNTFDKALGLNFLFTYRVNAGTAFYVGYEDRYQQADLIEEGTDFSSVADRLFRSDRFTRTNQAVFMKLQYLFRY